MFQIIEIAVGRYFSKKYIGALKKKFTIFAGKHLCSSLFLIKFQAFKPVILSKRDSNTGVFL